MTPYKRIGIDTNRHTYLPTLHLYLPSRQPILSYYSYQCIVVYLLIPQEGRIKDVYTNREGVTLLSFMCCNYSIIHTI